MRLTDPVWQALLVILISFCASFIQRVSGFGFGIFAITFLPYIMGTYGEANILSSMLALSMSISVAVRLFRSVDLKNLIFPLVGCTVSTYVSVNLIKGSADALLKLMLGAVLVLLSVYFLFFADRMHIKATRSAGLIAGLLSGILGGLFSMGGPPVVVYYMESEKDTRTYMATIQAYFALSNIYSVGVKLSAGFAGANTFAFFAVGLAGVAAGVFVGSRIFDKMDGAKIRKAVCVIMATSGLFNCADALSSIVG